MFVVRAVNYTKSFYVTRSTKILENQNYTFRLVSNEIFFLLCLNSVTALENDASKNPDHFSFAIPHFRGPKCFFRKNKKFFLQAKLQLYACLFNKIYNQFGPEQMRTKTFQTKKKHKFNLKMPENKVWHY